MSSLAAVILEGDSRVPGTSLWNNIRRWGSALDIPAMAELQDFNTLNLNPSFPIPEPGTFALPGFGLVGIAVGVRRRRRKAA